MSEAVKIIEDRHAKLSAYVECEFTWIMNAAVLMQDMMHLIHAYEMDAENRLKAERIEAGDSQ